MSEELLSTDEVAERIGVPTSTLRWWRHVGEGPKSFTLGKKIVRYKRSDVDEWLEREYAKVGGIA